MRVRTKELGDCAVHDCIRPMTSPVSYRGRVLAYVCAEHGKGDYTGWTLTFKSSQLPVLWPPGSLQ